MTKTINRYDTEKALREELRHLNEIIDRKILRGLSYSTEGRRHKLVLAQLSRVRGAADFAWFSHAFSFSR